MEVTAAALKSGWVKHEGLTKGICICSWAALQAQSKEESSARSCLLCPIPAGLRTSPALIQAQVATAWSGKALVRLKKQRQRERKTNICDVQALSKKCQCWERDQMPERLISSSEQQAPSTNIWLVGAHCYSQIFLSHQAAQSSLSTAPAAAWAVNPQRAPDHPAWDKWATGYSEDGRIWQTDRFQCGKMWYLGKHPPACMCSDGLSIWGINDFFYRRQKLFSLQYNSSDQVLFLGQYFNSQQKYRIIFYIQCHI